MQSTTFVGNPKHMTNPAYATWDPKEYSDGPIQIGFQGFVPSSNVPFIEACESALGIPIVKELNGGNNTGVRQGTGIIDGNFLRSSTYDAYYQHAKDRPNLDVLIRATVLRLTFEGNATKDNLRATGVVFLDELSGLPHNITATKEVIMSAGAFHSPALLMVSGIGPRAALEAVGIDPILVNEDIGQHMNDHNAFSVTAYAKPFPASTSIIVNDLGFQADIQAQFYDNFTARWHSPWSSPSGITNGFKTYTEDELRARGAGVLIERNFTNQVHMEFLYESIAYPGGKTNYFFGRRNASYISVTASNLVAQSRGNVTIGSPSALDYPVISPNVSVVLAI